MLSSGKRWFSSILLNVKLKVSKCCPPSDQLVFKLRTYPLHYNYPKSIVSTLSAIMRSERFFTVRPPIAFMECKRNTQNTLQTLEFFVGEQKCSLRCCLLGKIEDARGTLFMKSERQLITRVVLGSILCSQDFWNKWLK